MLPSAPRLKLSAVPVGSSGASVIATMSYRPCVQNISLTVTPTLFAICLKASARFGEFLSGLDALIGELGKYDKSRHRSHVAQIARRFFALRPCAKSPPLLAGQALAWWLLLPVGRRVMVEVVVEILGPHHEVRRTQPFHARTPNRAGVDRGYRRETHPRSVTGAAITGRS